MAEKSVVELADALASGQVTSRQLVDAYLGRIEAYDRGGPRLNAIVSLNARAREEAEALDNERRTRGARGLLHGIPMVVKDNFETAGLPTAAASIAFAGWQPSEDAFQVQRLREAGAIILGKTNMHELAWGITTVSSLAGQTHNPYDTTRNPGGSSGGTGAAVAASFAAAGMGTDTCGSIRYPAAHNNLVGLRATPGVSSRSGIVPASHTQDVAGPLARTIGDLAIVLDATVGPDPADPVTAAGVGKIDGSFRSHLRPDTLRGARIGVLEPLFGTQPEDEAVANVVRAAIEEMEKQGARAVPVSIPDFDRLVQGASVPLREFKFDFNDYLARRPGVPVRSLAEILDKGLFHAAVEDVLRRANDIPSRDTKEHADALIKRGVIRATILKLMDAEELTALAYPTLRRTASRIGEPQRGGNCTLASVADLPAITVPAGFASDDGMPVGLELLGRPFSDAVLVGLAYGYEQAGRHRRPPASTPGLASRGPVRLTAAATAPAGPRSGADVSAAGTFAFDERARRLEYRVTITGRAPHDVLGTDLHRAGAGDRGPVVLVLGGAGRAQVSGSLALAPAEARDLLGGRLYLDVHTRQNPAGEARGRVSAAPPETRQAAVSP